MLQGSVKTHLRFGATYNNHVIANFPESVPVKEFWKSVNNWQRHGQKLIGTFFGPPCSLISTLYVLTIMLMNFTMIILVGVNAKKKYAFYELFYFYCYVY